MPGAAGTGSTSSPSGRPVLAAPGRLTGKPEFERVFRQGFRFRGAAVRIVCLGNTLGITRLGFSVSRKMGCAAERNLFRRRIREALRQRIATPPGLDIVVYPAVKLSETTRREMEADLIAFADSLRLRGER
ncbi:MAG: ribonuclease P protein component [Candidatus Fermentibacter sp.]|nr:ribonuclease P protein component [Candidatus Fermentibacter sp.]